MASKLEKDATLADIPGDIATKASFLAAIVESSEDAIIGKTLDGIIVSWNKGAEHQYGYMAEEAIGKSVAMIIPKERTDELAKFLAMIKKGESVQPYETVRVRKDGSQVSVSVSVSPIHDSANLTVGAASVSRLITESKQAALYARSVIEAGLDPMFTISPEGKVTDVNEATVRITGVSRENIIGSDFINYFSDPKAALKGNQQVFEKGFVREYPLVIRSVSGALTDVLYNASVYKDDKGNVFGAIAAVRDVTASNKALLYARSVIEAGLDPMFTISPEGIVTDVNEATVRITGVAREKIIGSDFINYFSDPKEALKGNRQVFEKGFVREFPLVIQNISGVLTDVLYNASVYKDDRGNVFGAIAAVRDVTASKQALLYARSVIEAGLDPMFTISPEGKVTDVNEATVRITGVAREKIIGSDFVNYFSDPKEALKGNQQVFEKGFVREFPLVIQNISGVLTDVLYNASVYKDDRGNVFGAIAAVRDVTASKQALFYARSVIEAGLDPMISISPEGKVTDVNEATVRITGVAREKLIGSDFVNYFTDQEEAKQGYEQVFREGFVREYPLIIRSLSGTLTDVLYNASVYKDDKGKVFGAIAALRDITDQKKLDEKLHETSAYARSLIEASLDPLFIISPEGKITGVNRATEEITGVTREWLIDTDFSTYFTEPHKAQASYRQVLKEGLVRDFPLSIHDASGKTTDVSFNASVYKDAVGVVRGIFAVARDVTDTKKISQYARSLIEASQDPLFTISPEGKVTDANEATIKVTGVTREALVGTDFSNYFTEPQKAHDGYEQAFKLGFLTDYPLTFKSLDGKLTDVLYNASVYKDDKGKVLGITAAARDYTLAKKATEEAAKANKEMEAFSYSVSHDLRGPLRAIDGFTQILVEQYNDKLDDEGKRITSVIRASTVQMGKLIDDLLSFSRLGRQAVKKDPVIMGPLVEGVYRELKLNLPDRKIKFTLKELPDARADAAMIRMVWTNLLSNAIKFTKNTEAAMIEVGSTSDKDTITYYIKDNGAGFDMQYADKLFGVFQRLHSVEEFEGTGVGLANVKRIIERHGGTVRAEAKVGEGATFYFSLPKV